MSDAVRIPAPLPHSSASLVEYLQTHLPALSPALDFELRQFDEKAQVVRVQILMVTLTDAQILVQYRLEFSANYTCSGIDYAATHERTLRGHREADFWIFPHHVPLPERSTAEEF